MTLGDQVVPRSAASYRSRITAEGRIAWPTTVALSMGALTFVTEVLLGWWVNWADVNIDGWQADFFIYPFLFTPFGIVLTIAFSIVAGAGFGTKNRILGVVAGTLPLVGVIAMLLVGFIN